MARESLQIKIGTYTGNGVDSTSILGVGFRPELVIAKGGANVAVWRTSLNRGDSTMALAANTANATDQIQEILNDGFQVGTNAGVNASGTTYYYMAIRGLLGQSHFKVGKYFGNATDNRNVTDSGLIPFTPEMIWIKGDTAQNGPVRTQQVSGDISWHFAGTADGANEIQNLQANGFQIGTSARVNSADVEYFFAAFRQLSGVIACGTYIGNGVDNREIIGCDFKPDLVIVKDGTGTSAGILRTRDFVGDSSISLGGSAAAANQIQNLVFGGFQLGSSTNVNTNGNTYWWVAFKDGNHFTPISRTAA